MLIAFLTLIGCQLAGELISQVARVSIPGPVIGLFILTSILIIRSRKSDESVPTSLEQMAEALIGFMGLLFVPSGIGIVSEANLLRQEWLPILAALLGSTVLSVAVTGVIMRWTMRQTGESETPVRSVRPPRRSKS